MFYKGDIIMTLEQRFDHLEEQLAQLEGKDYARFIRDRLRHAMLDVLGNWNNFKKEPKWEFPMTSPDSVLVIQEFLTAFGMHLKNESSLATDDKTYLFCIYPNW